MNIQQLEYIVAVENFKHFGQAADNCCVTQPTLSAMIQKLETELGCKIFDRTQKPITPTEIGEQVIEQARNILIQVENIQELVKKKEGIIKGTLKIGIIPTLAPYLIPLFIDSFLKKYPQMKVSISENLTQHLVDKLKNQLIDVAIMSGPFNDKYLREDILFNEAFMIYTPNQYEKEYLLSEDLDVNQLWLLEEGHCFRSQVLKICELRKASQRQMEYEAGSIETLKQLVETQQGITILPQLATRSLNENQRKWLKSFAQPVPTREVSLITHRDYVKKRLVAALKQEIITYLPSNYL